MSKFSAGIGALAGAAGIAGIAASLTSFAKGSFEAADAIGDAADRAGVAVESLSKLKFAAEQSDVDFGSLTLALKRWQVTLSQAASGSQDAASAIGLLKLNATQLKSLSLEDQLKAVADQFARIKDPADQTRVAVELFGRAGEQLVPLLNKGGGAISDLTEEADRLGITLDQKTTGAVDRADKAIKKLLATLSAAGQRAVGSIAEAIVGPQDNIDAAEQTLARLEKDRNAFLRGAANFLPANQIQKELERLDARIAGARQALDVVKNSEAQAAADREKNALVIPDDSRIQDVLISQRKNELIGLAKLLDDFEVSTRTSEEKIYQDYKDTVAKIQELTGKISPEEQLKRLQDARVKFEEAVTIEPIDVNKIEAQKVVVTKVLTQQQLAVDKFVATIQTGLENLAHSGEITGRSILKYLLSAFEAQVLKDAIDGVGRYLRHSLGGSTSTGTGAAGNIIGSIIGGLFGSGGKSGEISPVVITQKHAAGGGSMSGPKVVGEDGPELDLGGGSIMNRRQLQFAMAGAGGISVHQGDVNVSTNATDPAAVAQFVNVVVQQNNKQLLDQLNKRLKDNYGRGLR